MNCRKCGQPLNGKTVCPSCGTSIGYVVNNPVGASLGPSGKSNGYVQPSTTSGYVQNNTVGFGYGVSEPTDGGFNKAHQPAQPNSVPNQANLGLVNMNNPISMNNNVVNNNSGVVNKTAQTPKKKVQKPVQKSKWLRGFKPLNKFDDEPPMHTNSNVLDGFNTPTGAVHPATSTKMKHAVGDTSAGVMARAGTMSKDMIIEAMNGPAATQGTGGTFTGLESGMNSVMNMGGGEVNTTSYTGNDGVEHQVTNMSLPGDMNYAPDSGGVITIDENTNKRTWLWVIALGAILAVTLIGVYVLPLFFDIGFETYNDEKFTIKYSNSWRTEVDKSTKKMHFLYKETGYKLIVNGVSTFESLNFKIDGPGDRKTLYFAFYNSWKNVSGGQLVGGNETFTDLEEDEGMYAKIDYVLDDGLGVGSFYVVVNQKYDIVISFMSYCRKADQKAFEEEVLKLIESIDYTGMTAEEKENAEYKTFKAANPKTYNAGALITYSIPDVWTFDAQRTAALNNQYNIFKFKDEKSLLEVKAYNGAYTYEGMKQSAIKSYGALQGESKKNVNGKVWYVMITPEYTSGGLIYHNEIYFTLSASNSKIYYVQAYVVGETNESKVKKAYFDDSITYILEKMTLHGVEQ